MQETWVQSLGWEDPLQEGMANHSSVLAWRILWTEEPGGLQSTGSQRIGHNLVIKRQQQAFLEPRGSLLFAVGRDSTSQAREGCVADSGVGAFWAPSSCGCLVFT